MIKSLKEKLIKIIFPYTYTYVFMYACKYKYICTSIYIYIYVYIYNSIMFSYHNVAPQVKIHGSTLACIQLSIFFFFAGYEGINVTKLASSSTKNDPTSCLLRGKFSQRHQQQLSQIIIVDNNLSSVSKLLTDYRGVCTPAAIRSFQRS